jgi:hypothetical protein
MEKVDPLTYARKSSNFRSVSWGLYSVRLQAPITDTTNERRGPPALVSATTGISVQIVAEELVLLAASVGCGTLIARFALTQLFRVARISRRDTTDTAR